MMTNTYCPIVGGVPMSVVSFSRKYRELGHEVLVVAPEFPNPPDIDEGVLRIPAIQRFNGSDFSVRLPAPGLLIRAMEDFHPDVIHSHHPFLLGDTALRLAEAWDLPLIFTHHTMYEQYTHYVPGDAPAMKRFVIELATGYANLCDQVIAPSESTSRLLVERGVTTPIEVIATGVDVARFASGDREWLRRRLNLPRDTFIVGHVGRLAPEKNLAFLASSVCAFLKNQLDAWFVVAGEGPEKSIIREICRNAGIEDRLLLLGAVRGNDLVHLYHAMDVFAFASHSETQGMVLTEAMAAGVPVVAVDAPGVREVVRDGDNGRLLLDDNVENFSRALFWIANLAPGERERIKSVAQATADRFSITQCAARALALYDRVSGAGHQGEARDDGLWSAALRLVEAEWHLWENRLHAAQAALSREHTEIRGSFPAKG